MTYSIIKNLDEKFLRYISKLKPELYCLFSNIRQIIICRPFTNFYYSKKLELYFAKEKNHLIYFFSKYRQIRLYSRSIKNRLYTLSSDYFINFIKFKKGDYVVDCGANIGELYLAIKINCNYNINYIAFEPSPKEFKCLSINAPNQKYLQMALSNKYEEKKFYISSEEADNSLIKPKYFSNTIKITTDRLDNIIKNKFIKLLKIDAEGAELEVLQGCENILNNIQYISVDCGPEKGLNAEPTFKEVLPFLIKKGFIVENISQKRYTILFFNPNFKK
tara:strand:+ start:12190 stop:13017 length:828 start_codon:yes stop_codon:yes gene_type:complete